MTQDDTSNLVLQEFINNLRVVRGLEDMIEKYYVPLLPISTSEMEKLEEGDELRDQYNGVLELFSSAVSITGGLRASFLKTVIHGDIIPHKFSEIWSTCFYGLNQEYHDTSPDFPRSHQSIIRAFKEHKAGDLETAFKHLVHSLIWRYHEHYEGNRWNSGILYLVKDDKHKALVELGGALILIENTPEYIGIVSRVAEGNRRIPGTVSFLEQDFEETLEGIRLTPKSFRAYIKNSEHLLKRMLKW